MKADAFLGRRIKNLSFWKAWIFTQIIIFFTATVTAAFVSTVDVEIIVKNIVKLQKLWHFQFECWNATFGWF